jgi:hypothetical protein
MSIYVEKLSKHWSLPEDSWVRATSRMVANLEAFPAIATIYKYLAGSVVSSGLKQDDQYWVTFRMGGKDCAIPCHDPSDPPLPPEGTENINLVVPPHKQQPFHRVSQDDARESFKTGYLESGGNPADLDRYWHAITKPPEPDRTPMWYDDKDIPDESEIPI